MQQPDSTERGANVNIPPPLVFIACIVLGALLQYGVAPIPFPDDAWIRIAGAIILVAALALIFSALATFKKTGQDPKPWKPTPELIIEGPYRWTRNPMYVGLASILVGLGLALNNLWFSLLAAAALVAVHFMAVLPEEKYLNEKFGRDYEDYRKKVRRYL
ncbi:MAG TPA: isoprenylcysteine carboxylmethyltransferase family protein [Gammaproteobacteria bacterium]|jgi:protein-S-isoprenylcysteine O-methyltransferase Ste14|nr:isoprenylcysteine carboxylmethyltransferase family protein [Gammaproteobacteria bacterium]